MKITLAFVVLEGLLFTSVLQQFSMAAPTHTTPAAGSGFDDDDASPDTVVPSCGFKKDSDHRNKIFGNYLCSIEKAKDLIRNKLKVSFKHMHIINH